MNLLLLVFILMVPPSTRFPAQSGFCLIYFGPHPSPDRMVHITPAYPHPCGMSVGGGETSTLILWELWSPPRSSFNLNIAIHAIKKKEWQLSTMKNSLKTHTLSLSVDFVLCLPASLTHPLSSRLRSEQKAGQMWGQACVLHLYSGAVAAGSFALLHCSKLWLYSYRPEGS